MMRDVAGRERENKNQEPDESARDEISGRREFSWNFLCTYVRKRYS